MTDRRSVKNTRRIIIDNHIRSTETASGVLMTSAIAQTLHFNAPQSFFSAERSRLETVI